MGLVQVYKRLVAFESVLDRKKLERFYWTFLHLSRELLTYVFVLGSSKSQCHPVNVSGLCSVTKRRFHQL